VTVETVAIVYDILGVEGQFSDGVLHGRADILWRHTSGQVAIWLMDGGRFLGDVYPAQIPTTWRIEGLLRDARSAPRTDERDRRTKTEHGQAVLRPFFAHRRAQRPRRVSQPLTRPFARVPRQLTAL
jgi:hypothetical protein